MADEPMPYQIIERMVADRAAATDRQVLDELAAFPPLPDEDDPAWQHDPTTREGWRLKPAVRLILDKMPFGEPFELFRGLHANFEAIVKPNWAELADICLEAVKSPRPGTRFWALDQLASLDDERARPVFEASVRSDHADTRSLAEVGLERLDRKRAQRG